MKSKMAIMANEIKMLIYFVGIIKLNMQNIKYQADKYINIYNSPF